LIVDSKNIVRAVAAVAAVVVAVVAAAAELQRSPSQWQVVIVA
jgi:hypothetical protein